MEIAEPQDEPQDERTYRHRMFAVSMKTRFAGTPVKVLTEHPIVGGLPHVDVVLDLRGADEWTEQERQHVIALLPDGLRDCLGFLVVIEVKATESCNEMVVRKMGGYLIFSYDYWDVPYQEMIGVLVCLQVPQKSHRAEMEYDLNPQPGVYRSKTLGRENIMIIAVSELTEDPHNALMRFFSMQIGVQAKAAHQLNHDPKVRLTLDMRMVIQGFQNFWQKLTQEDPTMTIPTTFTPEWFMELGKEHMRETLKEMPEKDISVMLKDLPYIHKIENRAIHQGIEKGREEGLQLVRANIVDMLRFRLHASESELRQVEEILLRMQNHADLQAVFQVALQAEQLSDFWDKLVPYTQ